jgi:hypothetical protein
MATLLTITFTAANKNAMQYLYEITRTPDLFRIEGFDIQAVGPDLVKVKVMVEAPATIKLLSNPKDSSSSKRAARKKCWAMPAREPKCSPNGSRGKKDNQDGCGHWMRIALQKAGLPLEEPPAPVEAAAPQRARPALRPACRAGGAVHGAAFFPRRRRCAIPAA